MRSRHPGLDGVLNKVHRNEHLTPEEVSRLQRQILQLENRARHAYEELRFAETIPAPSSARMIAGYANQQGCRRCAERFEGTFADFHRPAQGLLISSLGMGTYLGAENSTTDAEYVAALEAALRAGINLIDTSLNYRNQRAERSIGAAIGRFIESGGNRDEIVVCTKGGFLVPGAITENALLPEDIAAGVHSIAPPFIADQIRRSRENLRLEVIDVYYLHNPEVQLSAIGAQEFIDRIRAAFECLEHAVSAGEIRYYGTATWDGYRDGTLSLSVLAEVAREVAGNRHHFRFVQLPFSLGAPEALTRSAENGASPLAIASELGITVIASASLLQGRLTHDLPGEISSLIPRLHTDAQRSIQFTRSAPGIASALVGMRTVAHVEENIGVAGVPPLSPAEHRRVVSALLTLRDSS